MAKEYRVSKQVMEQAERMANKWQARADAFYQDWAVGEGGYTSAGYCKTIEEAERCEDQAEKIQEALSQVQGSVTTWNVVTILKSAASSRDMLDEEVGKWQKNI